MTLGYNFKIVRLELNLTQKQMAKKMGVSRPYYNKLENNRSSISAETLIYVSKKLNVPLSKLINDDTRLTKDVYNKKEMTDNETIPNINIYRLDRTNV
ncbi:TPA: helix-turn-helix domain-containing protein [Staphylococcus pseudintermedius]